MVSRRGLSFVARSALAVVATVAFIGSNVGPAAAQDNDVPVGTAEVPDAPTTADECIGTVTASLVAESLPSGEWSAHGDCLVGDNFYEFVKGPLLAKAAVAEVVYSDGHEGRVAAGVLTLGNGLGLGIVGVEDAATGLVKWSAVLDDFESDGDAVSVSGQGVAVFPIERATVSARLTGTGTDVKPFLEGYDATIDEAADPDTTGDLPARGDEQSSDGDDTDAVDPTGSVDGGSVRSGDTASYEARDDDAGSDAPDTAKTGDGVDGDAANGDGNGSGSGSSGSSGSDGAGIDYGVVDVPGRENRP